MPHKEHAKQVVHKEGCEGSRWSPDRHPLRRVHSPRGGWHEECSALLRADGDSSPPPGV